jgi:uncharacterized protein (TIGR03067 family)
MLSIIACSFLVAAPAPADAPADKEPAELQGSWRLESLDSDAGDLGLGLPEVRWVIQGTKVKYGGEEVADLTADPKATPKILNLSFLDSKKTYEGIYSVEKDTLKICLNAHSEGVKERPTDFSIEGKENLRLLVFRREKEAAEGTGGATGYVGLMLKFDQDKKEVVITDTLPKGPAEKAGLQKEDVVLKVGDVDVTDLSSAVNTVRQKKPGGELTFHVRRDGKEKDIAVKVGVLPFALLANLE